MKKKLSQILPAFNGEITAADGTKIEDISDFLNNPVENLVFDSREVTKNSLFFALPGTHTDGNKFIPSALKNGASVIVYQGELCDEIKNEAAKIIVQRSINGILETKTDCKDLNYTPVLIKVLDSRLSMAPISAAFYDNPSKKLIVIGVTGTEGKSSTVSFIWQLLRLCGKKAGFISTVEYSFGGEAISNPQHQTTPEAPVIQHHLNEMLENGCEYAVIETSSHGLSQKLNRCGNIFFDTGIFMNVTLEHLEFHKTFEQYRKDKSNLFRSLDSHNHTKTIAGEIKSINSLGIVNLEDPSADFFINSTKRKTVGFTTDGLAGKNDGQLPKIPDGISYLRAKNIESSKDKISFCVEKNGNYWKDNNEFFVTAPLPGAFNAYNIMASLIAVNSLTEIPVEEIASKTKEMVCVKGRMTEIKMGQPFEVIVDYAHTPSSFETIFPPIKKRCKGKLISVFGSGGERDLTKRPIQGKIAGKFCDTVILTDEDPRGENPVELLKMIATGAKESGKIMNENLFIITNRVEAIKYAFKNAEKDDIILLLGKSHENSIIYKDFVMPYDEISTAEKILLELGYKN